MTIEQAARGVWIHWGSAYAMNTRCSCCGEVRYCRGKRRAKMLCLDCFDLGEEKGRRKPPHSLVTSRRP